MKKISNRKSEHLRLAVEQFQFTEVMTDVHLLHDSLPELDLDEIDINSNLCGHSFLAPIMINAITGGSDEAYDINKQFARVASQLGIPMAVGSQKIALTEKTTKKSFEIVREYNPHGVIYANLGSYATPDMAKKACEIIDADGIQIHLNVPQELAMEEGDRSFRGVINNINEIVNSLHVPVMVKEVGFGLTSQNIKKLIELGSSAIDISGNTGTNFIKLENDRSVDPKLPSLKKWGLTTSQSLLEASVIDTSDVDLIASGGFSNALDLAKAISLNANTVAFAGYPLYLLWNYGEEKLLSSLKSILTELKAIMLMCGAQNLSELTQVPLLINNKLLEFANNRSINTKKYAHRMIEKTR